MKTGAPNKIKEKKRKGLEITIKQAIKRVGNNQRKNLHCHNNTAFPLHINNLA